MTSSNLANQLVSTTIVPVIVPLWDDCSLLAGSCEYLLSGTAPNRIFTIQYTNLRWNFSIHSPMFNLQVRLYVSGKIDFVYGSAGGTPGMPSASIGINMLPGGSGWFYSVTPGTPATASTTTENNTITVWPGEGTIYEFNPVVAVPNDLAALSVTGNTTPTAGQSSNYIVTVRNRGTNPQSTYQVKLLLGTQEIGSVNGTAIQPGEILTYIIPWTPTIEGSTVIYGKVLLAGDENSVNDQTSPANITVLPASIHSVTIGQGNELDKVPIDFNSKCSLFECLYYPDELGFASGTITSISFYNNFEVTPSNGTTKIWLGSTSQQDLSSGWIPSNQLTLVFNGNITYSSGYNTISIPLQTPYIHTPGNLIMMIQRPYENNTYSYYCKFFAQTGDIARSRIVYSGFNIDPANPPSSSTNSGLFPKTAIYYTGQPLINDLACISIKGNKTARVNSTSNYIITIKNNGTAIQQDYIVKIKNENGAELASSYGPIIHSLESIQISLPWLPTTPGYTNIYGEIIISNDEIITNNQSPNLNVTVITESSQMITIGNGNQNSRIPMDFNYKNSLYECLFFPEELGFTSATISAISFYNNFIDYPANGTTKIWLGSTTLSDLNAGWIPSTQLTLVLDGNIKYPTGNNIITILLQTPYIHNYGNLVMMIQRPMDTSTYSSSDYFQVQTIGSNRARNVQDNSTVFNPANPPASATISGVFPKTTFFYTNQYIYNDMICLDIIGDTTPTYSISSDYIITVLNNSPVTQSNYVVKLMQEGGIELGSVQGININSMQTLQYTISWTPSISGSTYLYGKIFMEGEDITQNNQSQNLFIVIQPPQTQVINIGIGNQLARVPFDFTYKNSLFECIYLPNELGFVNGTITSLALYNSFDYTSVNMPIKIWLGSSCYSDLSVSWIPSTQLTLVYDGILNFPSGTNKIAIPLQNPYNHTSGNLVMMVQSPWNNQLFANTDFFLCQTKGTNRARMISSNNDNYNPASPPSNATLFSQFPKITLYSTNISSGISISNIFETIQVLMNSSDNYIYLSDYFSADSPISYTISYNPHINCILSGSNILTFVPVTNWYGIEYLNIRATNQWGFYVEQTLKLTVLQTGIIEENFNNSGTMPDGWSQQHSGTTSFPWQPFQIEETNYAIKTMATIGGTANERLFSPNFNLTNYENIKVSFNSNFLPYTNGNGSLAYTLNNMTYTIVETYTISHSGIKTYSIPALDGKTSVKFRWIYSNTSTNSGQNNYWIIDNFKIFGIVKDTQAPEAVTGLSLVSQDNHSALLSWNPSSDLYFDRYELYISSDNNVTTTDRLWSVNNDYNLYFAQTTQTYINPLSDGEYWIAIRAIDQSNNSSPLSQSLYVRIDATGPTFSNPLPSGQPEPEWSNSRIVTIGCQINDLNNIELSSIKYRIDTNGNGIYEADEIWQALPPAKIMNGTKATISVNVSVEYSSEGVFAFEFQATDIYDNTGYSGTNGIEGIEDDWVVRIDTPPTPINNFYIQSVFNDAIILSWTASFDLNFAGYRIYYSTSPGVSDTDMLWDSSNDPQLAFAGEGIISTTITGLLPATRYYFILQAFDEVGHITQYPQVISAMTSSSAIPMTPQNLVITVSGYDIMLNWDAVTLDTSQNPTNISYYEVYVSDQPYFECNIDNLLCTTETPGLLIEGGAEYADRLFFQIKAVSGAITKKNKVLPQKK